MASGLPWVNRSITSRASGVWTRSRAVMARRLRNIPSEVSGSATTAGRR